MPAQLTVADTSNRFKSLMTQTDDYFYEWKYLVEESRGGAFACGQAAPQPLAHVADSRGSPPEHTDGRDTRTPREKSADVHNQQGARAGAEQDEAQGASGSTPRGQESVAQTLLAVEERLSAKMSSESASMTQAIQDLALLVREQQLRLEAMDDKLAKAVRAGADAANHTRDTALCSDLALSLPKPLAEPPTLSRPQDVVIFHRRDAAEARSSSWRPGAAGGAAGAGGPSPSHMDDLARSNVKEQEPLGRFSKLGQACVDQAHAVGHGASAGSNGASAGNGVTHMTSQAGGEAVDKGSVARHLLQEIANVRSKPARKQAPDGVPRVDMCKKAQGDAGDKQAPIHRCVDLHTCMC